MKKRDPKKQAKLQKIQIKRAAYEKARKQKLIARKSEQAKFRKGKNGRDLLLIALELILDQYV